MAQSLVLVQALKQVLKHQNVTYRDVAKHLGLSEASVKRMFASAHFSLERIDAICDLIGIKITDLLQHMQRLTQHIVQLTVDQEKIIVSDRKLCLITVCVMNYWKTPEILQYFSLSENECLKYLIQLDQLKIIELLPYNKIKLLISPRFSWIPNGPFQRFFQKFLLMNYLDSSFQEEKSIYKIGMLTQESLALLQKKMRHLAEEFVLLSEQDAVEPIDKRFGQVLFLMNSGWATGVFSDYLKMS